MRSDAIAAVSRRIAHCRYPAQDARLGEAECLAAIGYHSSVSAIPGNDQKHPNTPHFDTVLQRQFESAPVLAGERQKAWGIPGCRPLNRAVEVYEQVVKNGPYSPVAPESRSASGWRTRTA